MWEVYRILRSGAALSDREKQAQSNAAAPIIIILGNSSSIYQ